MWFKRNFIYRLSMIVFEAKIFLEDSGLGYGINDRLSRVSKLNILVDGKEVYNYDRGLDFDNCPVDVFEEVSCQCEDIMRKMDAGLIEYRLYE